METKTDGAMDVQEIWRSTLAALKERVPEPSFRTWLEGTRLREITEGRGKIAIAAVVVPSTFAAEWLRRRYSVAIAESLKNRMGHAVGVEFTVEAAPSRRAIHALDGIGPRIEERQLPIAVGQSGPVSADGRQMVARSQNSHVNASSAVADRRAGYDSPHPEERVRSLLPETRTLSGWPQARCGDPNPNPPVPGNINQPMSERDPGTHSTPVPVLNPRYTFERFLIGRGNQLAASVARQVAEEPGTAYNPLFIYGSWGVGKTHLLHAIGNDAHLRGGSNVLCVPAILFSNPATSRRLAAPDTLTNIDLLLVDDLHLIAGGSGRVAQRSLAVLVEGMLEAGKGVVVTASQSPDSMLALHDTLRSRLRSGMVVAIELPDAEMRLRMVGELARQADVVVAQGALELLASARLSMTEVVAAWERLSARCEQTDSPAIGDASGARARTRIIRVQDVHRLVEEITFDFALKPRVGPERIIDQVAAYFDLETNEICSASRERRVMVPRQIAMYLIREQTDRTYEWIAHRFARQDHTTAMHSCARIEELLETNLEVREMVLELRQMVFGEHERAQTMQLAS